MIAVLLALAAALGYGGSDFTAGMASRRGGVVMVATVSSTCSLVLSVLLLPWLAAPGPSFAPVAWGVGAEVGGVIGALSLYAGFRRAAFSVAGPISAVSAAGVSVVVGVLLGERPSALSLAGISIALPAIVLVSLTASAPGGQATDQASRWSGVPWGLLAGAGFGFLFVAFDRAGSSAGIWPVVAGQIAQVAVLAGVVVTMRLVGRSVPGLGRSGRTIMLALIAGVVGGGANLLYFAATHHGFLAITAVLSSLYPAVTIGLARLLAGERLSAGRVTGLLLAGASVALIALGGTS